MTVAALMLARDEADVVGYVLDHLEAQVDDLLAVDNGSSDGTAEILAARAPFFRRLAGYRYADIVSALAEEAWKLGHEWVVPWDADETRHVADDGRLGDWLAGQPPDVQVAEGFHLNYLETALDDAADENPLTRLRWREETPGWRKVACRRASVRLRFPDGAHTVAPRGRQADEMFVVRHYSWRTLEHAVAKIRQGAAAYEAQPDLPQTDALHWRRWGRATDAELAAWYREHYFSAAPELDGLVYDPAPGLP